MVAKLLKTRLKKAKKLCGLAINELIGSVSRSPFTFRLLVLRPVHPVIKTTFHEETEKLANTNLLVKIKLILINSWICLQSFQWVDVGRGRYKRCHIYNSPAEIEKGKTLIRYKLNRSLPSQ